MLTWRHPCRLNDLKMSAHTAEARVAMLELEIVGRAGHVLDWVAFHLKFEGIHSRT